MSGRLWLASFLAVVCLLAVVDLALLLVSISLAQQMILRYVELSTIRGKHCRLLENLAS